MAFEPKPLTPEGVDAALDKAKHYRLLNEPMHAESICLDILEVESSNQEAVVTLLLALTDQYDSQLGKRHARCQALLPLIADDYQRAYYSGMIAERRGIAHMRRGVPGSAHMAYEWMRDAMEQYETAMTMRPASDESAILRWNTCARIINNNPQLVPEPDQPYSPQIGE